jgi:hypothetical protein
MSQSGERIPTRRQVLGGLGLTGIALGMPGCSTLIDTHRKSASAGSADWNGERLFRAVQEYSAMGNHRVGTAVDAATNRWFAGQLRTMGGAIELQRFAFQRFDGTASVTIDDQPIPSMPLYYEAVGEFQSDNPCIAALKATTGDRPSQALQNAIAQAKAAGNTILVIATQGADGELSTPNVYPVLGSGVPTILVPGRFADALAKGKVKARFSGRIVPGESNNVVARFGDQAKAPLVIATPLSGWFTCAAERGTGIAVALALANRFGRERPVLVIGSPGHEILHHIGLEEYLKANNVAARLVLHLGANVALGVRDANSGEVSLAPGINNPKAIPEAGRAVFVRMDETRFRTIEPELAKADLLSVLNPPAWNGEGALWAKASPGDLISFTGIHPLFHTSGDIPEATTSPEALARVYQATAKAVSEYFK